jgi:hypothetical protein
MNDDFTTDYMICGYSLPYTKKFAISENECLMIRGSEPLPLLHVLDDISDQHLKRQLPISTCMYKVIDAWRVHLSSLLPWPS